MNSAPHDDDDSFAAGFARRDREIARFAVRAKPAPSAPQTDEELAREAIAKPMPIPYESLFESITTACAAARALGRAEARGAATAPSGTPTPPDPATPATDILEHVGAIVWATWWKTHGEHDPSFEFSQLYETARQRWLDIAAAGIDAYLSKRGEPKSAPLSLPRPAKTPRA